MSPPSHHQGHHPATHLLVSTAQSMTGHPLDASTGTQPWTKPQRPAHVTVYIIQFTDLIKVSVCALYLLHDIIGRIAQFCSLNILLDWEPKTSME